MSEDNCEQEKIISPEFDTSFRITSEGSTVLSLTLIQMKTPASLHSKS